MQKAKQNIHLKLIKPLAPGICGGYLDYIVFKLFRQNSSSGFEILCHRASLMTNTCSENGLLQSDMKSLSVSKLTQIYVAT